MKVIDKTRWPMAKITGGPHGKNTVIEIGGQKLEKVSRVELVLDAMDAVRLTVWQFVEATVEIEVPGISKLTRIKIYGLIPNLETDTMDRELLAAGDGATLRQALHAAADSLPPEVTDELVQ